MNPLRDNPKPPDGPLWPIWKEKWSEDTELKDPLEDALETDPQSIFRALFHRFKSRNRKPDRDDQGV